jgi:RNA polymerase sigma factor (sigma-70 family)
MTLQNTEDDQALFVRFQASGSDAAFATLYARYKDALYRYLRHLSGSDAIASDVFQHTWLKLIELARDGRYQARAQASFRAYLYTLGRNHFLDTYRRGHEETRTESLDRHAAAHDVADNVRPTPEEAHHLGQRDAALLHALAQLPDAQREVAMMWSQGWSIAEIAALTGAPPDTVASRRKYALARLRELLAHSGLVGSQP